MFKFLGFLLKSVLLIAIVLVLGQVLEIDGKTVSDHVKSGIRMAEKNEGVAELKEKAQSLLRDSEKGARSPANESSDAKELSRNLQAFREAKAKEKAALQELLKD